MRPARLVSRVGGSCSAGLLRTGGFLAAEECRLAEEADAHEQHDDPDQENVNVLRHEPQVGQERPEDDELQPGPDTEEPQKNLGIPHTPSSTKTLR